MRIQADTERRKRREPDQGGSSLAQSFSREGPPAAAALEEAAEPPAEEKAEEVPHHQTVQGDRSRIGRFAWGVSLSGRGERAASGGQQPDHPPAGTAGRTRARSKAKVSPRNCNLGGARRLTMTGGGARRAGSSGLSKVCSSSPRSSVRLHPSSCVRRLNASGVSAAWSLLKRSRLRSKRRHLLSRRPVRLRSPSRSPQKRRKVRQAPHLRGTGPGFLYCRRWPVRHA